MGLVIFDDNIKCYTRAKKSKDICQDNKISSLINKKNIENNGNSQSIIKRLKTYKRKNKLNKKNF